MKKLTAIFAAFAAILFVASCTLDEVSTLSQETTTEEIGIRTMGQNGLTKSAINGTAFPAGYDMLVSAYRNVGSHAGGDAAANYFTGIQFAKDATSGSWKSIKGAKYWPLDGTLDFLAVASAGYNTAANGIAPTCVWGESSNVAKKVVLTVPDNSGKFDDLLFGASNAQSPSAAGCNMVFKHAMTSVVFTAHSNVAYNSTDNVGITIDGITIDGAKYSGTLTISNPQAGGNTNGADLSAVWSNLGDQKTHVSARVWNSANTGTNASEPALGNLNLTTTSKTIAEKPFGEGYVILPEQATVPFTVTYTVHNGKDADGNALNNQMQYKYTPAAGTWEMGKKYIYDLVFTLTEIQINPTVVDWDNQGPFAAPIPATFAGLQIAPGNLYYYGTKYSIASSWNNSSYNSVYGKNNGSYYFTFIQLGRLFEKADFSPRDGDIENLLDPLGGWRLPTYAELKRILTTSSSVRAGSTVNGEASKHYALVQLTGVTHAGSSTPRGLMIFPDGLTITGKALDGMDNTTWTIGMTRAELNAYLAQGCAFLPASGSYESIGGWNGGGTHGEYWSAAGRDQYFTFFNNYLLPGTSMAYGNEKPDCYFSVRLVK